MVLKNNTDIISAHDAHDVGCLQLNQSIHYSEIFDKISVIFKILKFRILASNTKFNSTIVPAFQLVFLCVASNCHLVNVYK